MNKNDYCHQLKVSKDNELVVKHDEVPCLYTGLYVSFLAVYNKDLTVEFSIDDANQPEAIWQKLDIA